jgi:hypothetical protein
MPYVRVCSFYDEIILYARTACVDIVRRVDWIMPACVLCALAYPNSVLPELLWQLGH